MILGVLSIFILYEIGKILLNQKIAWLAAAILSVEFLWLQYCRLGTPDVPMIFLVLLAILALLKAELNPQYRYMRNFLAQPAITQILQDHSIQFVKVGGKTGVLLDFYTPHHGDDVDTISELPVYSYAWISPQRATDISTPHCVLGTVQKHQLIQILPMTDDK